MFDRDLRRTTTAGVHVLIALAEERGMSAADCLAGSMLSPADTECMAQQELQVIRNLLARFGDDSRDQRLARDVHGGAAHVEDRIDRQ